MKNIVFKKENGEVRIINADDELLHFIRTEVTNPCINCERGYVTKCQKMADEHKNISNYDFITDGYQINKENGELESLVICNCTNFENDHKRLKAKTKEQLDELKRLRESIKILYFGGVDIEEANQIQSDLINRGFLSDVENSVAHHEFMKKLMK